MCVLFLLLLHLSYTSQVEMPIFLFGLQRVCPMLCRPIKRVTTSNKKKNNARKTLLPSSFSLPLSLFLSLALSRSLLALVSRMCFQLSTISLRTSEKKEEILISLPSPPCIRPDMLMRNARQHHSLSSSSTTIVTTPPPSTVLIFSPPNFYPHTHFTPFSHL
ncbi:MAG: hypothetical protein J3R72DRAFT_441108 [Linnemannia gamsii]|nr:MAG: hypothetical protein J3R72DRAFT_441108 [Linnemannia gamsii]